MSNLLSNGITGAPTDNDSDNVVVEVLLALPGGQLHQLQQVAERRGLTAGQLLRRLTSEFLAHEHEADRRGDKHDWSAHSVKAN
jgi:hypothetical protein